MMVFMADDASNIAVNVYIESDHWCDKFYGIP